MQDLSSDGAHGSALIYETEPGRKEGGLSMSLTLRWDWGRNAEVLYRVLIVLVLCGLQESKMGCGAAGDEGSIEIEQDSVGG